MTNNKSRDDFIDEPNKVISMRSRKNPSKKNVLLTIAGQKSKEIKASRKIMYFKEDIFDDIEQYCLGSFSGVINYLVRKGLDELVRNGVKITEEA
jgi:hypothetical protein